MLFGHCPVLKGRQTGNKGFSLIEMMIGVAMFSLLMVLVINLFGTFNRCWVVIQSKNESHQKFVRVSYNMDRELTRTDCAKVMVDLTGLQNWVCFSSPMDKDGNPHCDSSGLPVWQKYILFYAVRPKGDTCAAATGADDICPHKFLVRKDIDLTANIVSEAAVIPYLTQSLTTKEAAMEPGIITVKPVTRNVLDFKSSVNNGKVYFKMRVLRLDEARKILNIGVDHLSIPPQSRFLNEFVWSVIPKNQVE